MACSTEVNAIEDTKPCADGALDADGRPVMLGDACYDEWAQAVAEVSSDVSTAMENVLAPCIALAEALGMPDTWSALEDPIDKSVAACASLESVDLQPEWGCMVEVSDGDPCGAFSFTCTTDMPPAWLAELAAAIPPMGAACCAVEKGIDELSVLFSPSCEASVPGVAECSAELATSVVEMVEKSARMCGHVEVYVTN